MATNIAFTRDPWGGGQADQGNCKGWRVEVESSRGRMIKMGMGKGKVLYMKTAPGLHRMHWVQISNVGSTKETWSCMLAQLYRQVHMVSPQMVRCAQMLLRWKTMDQVQQVMEQYFRSCSDQGTEWNFRISTTMLFWDVLEKSSNTQQKIIVVRSQNFTNLRTNESMNLILQK